MDSTEQKLNELIEREREISKKINIAYRAGASASVVNQLIFLLEECKSQQAEIRQLKSHNGKNNNFDDYLSIGWC